MGALRHARWITALSGALACGDAHEIAMPEAGAATGSDAGLDASSEPDTAMDAGDAAPPRDADASAGGGGVCDAGRLCSTRQTDGVTCGATICTGDRPVCCRHDYVVPVAQFCVERDQTASCVPGAPVPTGVAALCDEAADCPSGQVCVDSTRKGGGVGRTEGARCVAACGPYPHYAFQICQSDCECVRGARCVSGACDSRLE